MTRKLFVNICDQCRVIIGNKEFVLNASGDEFCSPECRLEYGENQQENQERELDCCE